MFGAAVSNASAVLIVTTNGTNHSRFDSAALNPVTTVQVTGMQAGDSLIGIDFRPATGELFGIGPTNRVYAIDYIIGVATQVANPGAFNINATGCTDQEAQVQATGIPPTDGREAAFAGTASPGAYTATVRGTGDSTGIAVVEVYALD